VAGAGDGPSTCHLAARGSHGCCWCPSAFVSDHIETTARSALLLRRDRRTGGILRTRWRTRSTISALPYARALAGLLRSAEAAGRLMGPSVVVAGAERRGLAVRGRCGKEFSTPSIAGGEDRAGGKRGPDSCRASCWSGALGLLDRTRRLGRAVREALHRPSPCRPAATLLFVDGYGTSTLSRAGPAEAIG